MAKVLSQYAQTKDVSKTSLQYTSQKDYVTALADKQKATAAVDYESPFSFKDWLHRNIGIIPGEEYNQYNVYLKEWYASRFEETDIITNVKADYIALLKELAITFKDQATFEEFQDINFNDDLEIENAIPIFARKLKEIAIYLVVKRDAIRKAKLKYNMAGSTNALQKLFYEYLLKAFTQRDYVLNIPEVSTYNLLPELSAVKDGFRIEIQELYDDTEYFDKSPTMPISGYYDLSSAVVTAYFDSLNFDIGNLEWLFSTGVTHLCADNPLLWTLSSMVDDLSAYDDVYKHRLNDYYRIDLTKKYLGEKQFILSGGYYVLDTRMFDYILQTGNNWFYWPSGEYFKEVPTDVTFNDLSLTASNLINSGAAGASNYKDADKIFVYNCGSLSGAWLKHNTQTTISVNMSASIPIDNCDGFHFKFPYPGRGVSGDGIEWTGHQLDNLDSTYDYLDKDVQKDIDTLYWSTTSLSAINPLSIHNTNLIENGAIASLNYNEADKITIRTATSSDFIHDNTPDSVYKGSFDRAWLYKMLKTDIPVKIGQNYIYWPLLNYEQGSPLPINILSSQCIDMPLSSINLQRTFDGCRCGHDLYDSDLIYKLDSADGYPIECAWLQGNHDIETLGTTLVHQATGKIQPTFTLKCRPGTYETFLWQDSTIAINQTTINHKPHQLDCPYLNVDHDSIYNARSYTLDQLGRTENGLSNWKTCACKSILYSPIGHPGSTYDEYDRMADILFVDTMYPSAFDINAWRGEDGKPYNQSQDFAWYQLANVGTNIDVDWAPGDWKTGANTTTFMLSTGRLYKYLRANLRRNPTDLIQGAVPELYIRQPHSTNKTYAQWKKAYLQEDGTWLASNDTSDMTLKPGDFTMYDHMDTNWYCLTSIGTYGPVSSYITLGVSPDTTAGQVAWTNFSMVTTGVKVRVQWPDISYTNGPSYLASNLAAVTWYVRLSSIAQPGFVNVFSAVQVDVAQEYVFIPTQSGIYSIKAIGYEGSTAVETINYDTKIPSVTCFGSVLQVSTSGHHTSNTIYNDRLNFTINLPLTGWNYTTNTYDPTALGGRPFWAKASDGNDITTKYKGIGVYGGGIKTPIDSYTFVTQPDLATTILSSDSYIKYDHKGSGITWIQPLDVTTNISEKQWCKLNVYGYNITSPLSSYLYNVSSELVITALDVPSDIIFTHDGNTYINYWSVSGFTWTQELTNITNGYPPTGGVWIEAITGNLVDPLVPYANLTNRHYPTIATMPYVGGLYSTEDSGGYFIPKTLGASVYLDKNINLLKTELISNDPNMRGLTCTFRDPTKYISDQGLSNETQYTPISAGPRDDKWMKEEVTGQYKAGSIINTKEYQNFVPYKTKYETTSKNSIGLRQQQDIFDPWSSDKDIVWVDSINYPPDFRKQYNIDNWYAENYIPVDKTIFQWKNDIFGNQYALLKDRSIQGIYNKRQAVGELWVRNQIGKVDTANNLLSSVYSDLSFYSTDVCAQLTSNQIKNFDIWYDTLMIYTTGYVLVQKLIFDYDTCEIQSITDNIHVISLSANQGGHFGGTWLFDEDKKVTLCVLSSATNYVYPIVYNFDLNTNKQVEVFNGYNNTNFIQLTSVSLTAIEEPVFSYNNVTNTYDLTFIGFNNTYETRILTDIKLKDIDKVNNNITVQVILPLV